MNDCGNSGLETYMGEEERLRREKWIEMQKQVWHPNERKGGE